MRVVLDTNILISALITSVSPSAQVFALWRSRRFDLLTCAQQLEEFARATRYPQVRARLLPAVAGALLNRVRERAMVLKTLPKPDIAPDPDDNYLLALAESGEAQFLVTGDKPLLGLKRHKSTRIVTPAALLELLKDGNK